MPRIHRITIKNSCYHIITRGNQKQSVFLESKDYNKYLSLLKKYKEKYQFRLYAFCLMPNHIHLLIEVTEPQTLQKTFRGLNLSYTLYFNYKYKKVGHLWQGRFKSKPILKGRCLINCANYIEANPVRKKMVDDIAEYQWSSYKERCLLTNKLILDDIIIKA